MMPTKEVLATVRQHMARGEVADAVDLLAYLWTTTDLAGLHQVTLELADRFPLSPEASALLDHATVTYVAKGSLTAAAEMARRKLAIWRSRGQADPTPDTLDGHLEALDALASVYWAQARPDAVVECLVEVLEWQVTHGHRSGVAWALREMGAVALTAGEPATAAERLLRAEEAYGECGDDPEIARERAECRVLLGRVRRAQGDEAEAHRWFTEALTDLGNTDSGADDDAAAEVHGLLWAVEAGAALPAPIVLATGEFGRRDLALEH